MAVFFAVALMTVIPGTMLQMSRENREIQRYVDQVPLSFAADGLQERAVKLLSDWVLTKGSFPMATAGLDPNGYPVSDSDSALTGGQDINTFLKDWYGASSDCSVSSFKCRYKDAAPILNTINVSDVKVFESDLHNDPLKRKYRVIVNFTQAATAYRMGLEQEFEITNARLFDLSVFYNDDLEITAGPDFTLQGPIFSNKDIYMMNHRGSTLNLLRAPGFDLAEREPYVMNASGNIYFYFKRATAPNYLLGNSTYSNSVPQYYKDAPGGLELFAHPIQGAVNPKLVSPPFAYYFKNSALLGYPIDGCGYNCPASNQINTIQTEDADGGPLVKLSPPRSTIQFTSWWHVSEGQYFFYSPLSPYDSGVISVSTAFDSGDLAAPKPLANPSWPSSGAASGMVKSKVPQKGLGIGDPSHPHGAHAAIEPLSSIFPAGHPGSACASSGDPACVDSTEVKKAKFQQKAIDSGLNLYLNTNGQVSNDLKKLYETDPGIVTGISPQTICFGGCFTSWAANSTLYDYRLGLNAAVITIDIGKLVSHLSNPNFMEGRFNNASGVLIYVHTYPMRQNSWDFQVLPRFVRLINGDKLPEHGLTVASNGRVFVQGDYNTYVYPTKTTPPPAAIISDSVVVLSNQWSNSYNANTSVLDRGVTQDVTVNTALATGYLPSELEPAYTCNADMSNCMAKRNLGGPDSDKLGVPIFSGGVWWLNAFSANWTCGDNTWQNGKDGVSSNCFYYEEPAGPGLFYLNPKSTTYQNAINNYPPPAGGSLPVCDPAANGGPTDCDNIRIPIYADPNDPQYAGNPSRIPNTDYGPAIRPFVGIAFRTLHPKSVCYNGVCSRTETTYSCPGGETPVPQCLQWQQQGGGEGGDPIMVCVLYGDWICPSTGNRAASQINVIPYPHSVNYDGTRGYEPLYKVHHSGGLENLINLQENWNGRALQFSGTLSAPWFAAELRVGSVKKYFGESYYYAPQRVFSYNKDLRVNPPPAVPSVFSVDRKSWKIKSP